jgi:hypothetical protein
MRLVSLFDEGVRNGIVPGSEVVDLTGPMIGPPGDMAPACR